MNEKWFFTRDGDVVLLRGRFEADDGTIGDAFKVVRPGRERVRLLLSEAVQREGGHARDREGREATHRVAAPGGPVRSRSARRSPRKGSMRRSIGFPGRTACQLSG